MKKICSICKIEKPICEFGPRHGKLNARASCRSCDAAYQRAYRRRNLEKCRKRNRECEAGRRADPKTRERILEIQRKCYKNGGREYQQVYLADLKKTNFFRWKARKSYVKLTEHELRQLWDRQDGRCALTGCLLDNGAELDHIIPRTRSGGDNYENMRWLCVDANQAKRNLLDGEFLRLCREVISWADQDQL